jgi:arginine decarboxylase-like protein
MTHDELAQLRALRKTLTKEDRLAAAIEMLLCDIGCDSDGQIVLYSGLQYDESQNVVPFE